MSLLFQQWGNILNFGKKKCFASTESEKFKETELLHYNWSVEIFLVLIKQTLQLSEIVRMINKINNPTISLLYEQ